MWRDDSLLLDILIAARQTVEFTEGKSAEDFQGDRVLQYAVMRLIQIIGGAASKVSRETREAHPDIPWEDVIGMRHRLIHDYFRVDIEKVWETVRDDLPPLIAVVEPLVPPDEGD